MSEIQKVLNLIRGGRGGLKFSKSSEIQKVLNYPRGGGSSLIGNFSQIFRFFLVMAPLSLLEELVEDPVKWLVKVLKRTRLDFDVDLHRGQKRHYWNFLLLPLYFLFLL